MEYLFLIAILLLSIVIHEVSHGAMANYLGDSTAKISGRLTLNPIRHLDPIGSILIPLILIIAKSPFLIGWAKPVPVNPFNLRDPKWDMAKIAIAGPVSNFSIVLFFSLLVNFFALPANLLTIFSIIIFINLLLGVFNLMPFPPLDGSKILFAFFPSLAPFMERFSLAIFFIFLFLIISGTIPLFYLVFLFFNLAAGPEAGEALLQFFTSMG
jgi:Zn-dependent protease